MISTIGKKLVNLQGLPYMIPNLVKFSPKTAANGWRVFANPAKCSHWDTRTAWTLYNKQQANFGTCYVVARAYSLEPHNAGRARGRLCHASSLNYFAGTRKQIGLLLYYCYG